MIFISQILTLSLLLTSFSYARSLNPASRHEHPGRGRSAFRISSNCENVFKSKELSLFLQGLNQIKKLNGPLWFKYKPELGNTVLTHSELGSNCAVVISNSKIVGQLDVTEPVKVENGLYEFYFEAQSKPIPPALRSFLERSGIKIAMFYNLNELDIGRGSLVTDPKMTLPEFIDTYVHELFHAYTGWAAYKKSKFGLPWPKWDLQPDRDKIDTLCYTASVALPWTQREQEMAIKIMQSLFATNDMKSALILGREFLKIRKMRYQALADVRVPSEYVPGGITCDQAEAIMELEEGGAQFVGSITALEAGLYPLATVIKYMGDLNYWYYMTGSVQLSLLYRLNSPQQMNQIITRISHSPRWDQSIGYEFAKAVGGRL